VTDKPVINDHGYARRVTITIPLGVAQPLNKGLGAMKRSKREPPWKWSEGYTGKDVAQLSEEELANELVQFLQKLNKGGVVLSDEELARGLARHFELIKKRQRDGMDLDEARRLATAEQLYDEHPHPQWLLGFAALQLMVQYKPKFKAERKQEEAERKREMERRLDWATINCWAEILRDQGVRNYRGKAKEMYAEWMGITVEAIKQRRRRERRRRERRK